MSDLSLSAEVYSTAKDVLAATHDRVTARVKKALSEAAKHSESKEKQEKAVEQFDSRKPPSSKPASSSSAHSNRLLDGVSTALLERVCHCGLCDG